MGRYLERGHESKQKPDRHATTHVATRAVLLGARCLTESGALSQRQIECRAESCPSVARGVRCVSRRVLRFEVAPETLALFREAAELTIGPAIAASFSSRR